MNIEEASVFAKNISANQPPGPPPLGPEIYFSKGQFNPLYVPEGFNFYTNQHKLRFTSRYIADINFPAEFLNDNSVLLVQTASGEGIDGEYFGMDNLGFINLSHHPAPYGSLQSVSYRQFVMLPVTNIHSLMNDRRYLCLKVRFISNTPDYNIDGNFFTSIKLSSIQIDNKDGGGIACYYDFDLPCEWRTLVGDSNRWSANNADYIIFSTNIWEYKNNPMDLEVQIEEIFATNEL